MDEPKVIFESPAYVVLDKPAGWFSIPAREPASGDRVVSQWLGARAPFTVHRLDRYTSGIMVFAKSEESHKQANLWFSNRMVKKTYQFLASPTNEQAIPTRPAIQIKTPIDGKPAQTLFEIIKKSNQTLLVKATPLTGRFHQIREHALEAGFPLLGDKAFHGLCDQKIPRVMLHAFSLQLPFGTFEAPLPDDFKQCMMEFGL